MRVIDTAICILSGATVCLPLVIKLLRLAADSVREKSWRGVVALTAELMAQAEREIASGSDRREWVVDMTMTAAGKLGCEISKDELGQLVDELCAMAKRVNIRGEAEGK